MSVYMHWFAWKGNSMKGRVPACSTHLSSRTAMNHSLVSLTPQLQSVRGNTYGIVFDFPAFIGHLVVESAFSSVLSAFLSLPSPPTSPPSYTHHHIESRGNQSPRNNNYLIKLVNGSTAFGAPFHPTSLAKNRKHHTLCSVIIYPGGQTQ